MSILSVGSFLSKLVELALGVSNFVFTDIFLGVAITVLSVATLYSIIKEILPIN